MNIVSVGETTIDRYLRQNRLFVGGISLNFAVNAKQAGAERVSLVSCVGSDDGQVVLDMLTKEGIDQTHIAVLPGKTAECAIEVLYDGDRVFPADGYHENVLAQLTLTPAIIDFINLHDIVVTMYDAHKPDSMLIQLLESTRPNIKHVVDFGDWSNGRSKPLDPDLLNQLDIAFFSGDDTTERVLTPLVTNENCLVVVTKGPAGSVAISRGLPMRQQAIKAEKVVDTTGCGDAFQAAFTVSYFDNQDIYTALKVAADRAATVLDHYGAFSQ